MRTDSPWRRTFARITIAVGAALVVIAAAPGAAGAASIAYIDGGDVWLSSLDGQQKVRLATPVVNAGGETEQWLAVAASDGGRIVAVRNVPGRSPLLSMFKVWEPNGTSTVEGPLDAPGGWAQYRYPLGFDVTADGANMVYGYLNTSSCCPETDALGTYVRPVTNSSPAAIAVIGQAHPTLFGNRMVAHTDEIVNVQGTSAPPYGGDFTSWIDDSLLGLDLRRTDIAANGQLAAFELEHWDGGTQDDRQDRRAGDPGRRSVAHGPRRRGLLDADGRGRHRCVAVTGRHADRLDRRRRPQGGGHADHPHGPVRADLAARRDLPDGLAGRDRRDGRGRVPAHVRSAADRRPTVRRPTVRRPAWVAMVATVPRKVTAKALAGRKGVPIKVKVARAGKVKVAGSVAAKVLRSSRSIVVARGSTTAKRAGTVTVRLRLTTAARKKWRRLKGARMTLRVTQGSRTVTKSFKLR